MDQTKIGALSAAEWWLGPTVSVAHAVRDVQAYLDAIGEFTHAIA